MKTVLTNNPTFTPGAAGVGSLNFSNTSTFVLNRLFAVLNQTRNVMIYANTVSGTGYTTYNSGTKVLVLQASTATHNAGDSLICIYDDPNATVALAAGTASVGTVGLNAGSASIGTVGLNAGSNTIGSVNVLGGNATAVKTDGSAVTQPVSGTVALGTGSATIGSVNVLGGNATAVKTDGSAVTQPVSGTVAIGTGSATIGSVNVLGGNVTAVKTDGSGVTQPISAASLPLPSGAATNAVLTDGTQKTQVTSLPALPAGANAIGTVNPNSASATSSISTPSGQFFVTTTNFSTLSFAATSTTATTGQISVQGTIDGLNWFNTSFVSIASGAPANAFNCNALIAGQVNVSGFTTVRFVANGANNGIVTIWYSNSAGVASVHLDNSLPAGSNTIGNVGVTGSLPLPTGASTEATLLALKNAYLNGPVSNFTLSSVLTSQSFSCGNSGSVVLYITGTWPVGVTLTIESSVDGSAYAPAVPFVNLLTGTSVTSLAGTGASVTYLIAASAVGLANIKVNSSGTWSSGSATVKYVTSEKIVNVGATAAASVSVTNFPATQPVSGTVAVSNAVNWDSSAISGINDIPISPPPSLTAFNSKTSLLGFKFNLSDIAETGYGLETVFLKVFIGSFPTLGTTAPTFTIPVSSGNVLLKEYFFPSPGLKFSSSNIYICITRGSDLSDATIPVSTLRATVFF